MMHTELLNVFVATASDVLALEIGLHATHGPLGLQREAYVTEDVTVIISLVGDVWGMVLYGMSLDTARGILSHMLGQEMEDFDALAQSGIAELGNVITGQACTRLASLGLAAEVSVPALIIGKGSRISTLDIDRLTVPLETELGTIRLDLALRVARTADRWRGAGMGQVTTR